MTGRAATQPIGSALRIAPAFVATTRDEHAGVETTIEAMYSADRGRYVITTILNRAISDEFSDYRLRHTAPQAILQTAIPRCITVKLEDGPNERWLTVSDLTSSADGRIIPPWMAAAVVKRGVKDERWDVIEILYGTAALADGSPVKLISLELDVPERTAQDWIRSARAAGRLEGLESNVGRPRT
ncbi:hypothetical protein JNB63_07290 [Microbacterium trichothecenolyticum]|uniref:Uncharacterized protein n=2 Tax=Microbacteriaceae TaxID=85023 RepID=A0ABS7HUG2_9MICO|nr:hypothetical protein [Microbacterium ureisolvens]MBW9119890.1 hypothetical protein [Microbacterium trichothecenolyticum]